MDICKYMCHGTHMSMYVQWHIYGHMCQLRFSFALPKGEPHLTLPYVKRTLTRSGKLFNYEQNLRRYVLSMSMGHMWTYANICAMGHMSMYVPWHIYGHMCQLRFFCTSQRCTTLNPASYYKNIDQCWQILGFRV